MIFNKITSSSMTLLDGNRHSCRICLATERYFHIKSFSGEIFSALAHWFTFPWQGLFNPSAGFVIPKRFSISPITDFCFPKWSSFNARKVLSFAKWREIAVITVNLYPLRRRSQNIALIFNFEAPFETLHSAALAQTSKAVAAYWDHTS